eukprot:UN04729
MCYSFGAPERNNCQYVETDITRRSLHVSRSRLNIASELLQESRSLASHSSVSIVDNEDDPALTPCLNVLFLARAIRTSVNVKIQTTREEACNISDDNQTPEMLPVKRNHNQTPT